MSSAALLMKQCVSAIVIRFNKPFSFSFQHIVADTLESLWIPIAVTLIYFAPNSKVHILISNEKLHHQKYLVNGYVKQ